MSRAGIRSEFDFAAVWPSAVCVVLMTNYFTRERWRSKVKKKNHHQNKGNAEFKENVKMQTRRVFFLKVVVSST